MSYAIVRTGGKQHRVQKGERLKVDRLDGEVGSELVLGDVLLVGGEGAVKVGRPLVSGAKVTAKIVTQDRGAKIRVFKRRKRKGFHKTIGHRQAFTEVEITGIAG
jgi:large subunit ribosomal protein L21